MRNPARKMLAAALVISASGVLPGIAAATSMKAEADMFQTECSACHMAFPAQFLPVRAWHTIMATLDNHFGEDATLDDASRAAIKDYLVANAADAPGSRTTWMLRGVGDSDVILRITEMPWWVSEHRGEVSQRSWNRAGSKSNCTACHRSAGSGGGYDDD